jgi:5'-nucleotidase
VKGETMKKNFLVVNDDGYFDEGIEILKTALKEFGNVYVVAPLEEQSGKSHSVSIFRNAFEMKKFTDQELAISGTPADCTRFGLDYFNVKFDAVFSGVNNGANLGQDVFYSGTVAGATEGSLHGIPGVAFSVGSKGHFSVVRRHIKDVIRYLLEEEVLTTQAVLNINFPNRHHETMKGIRFSKQGKKETKVHFIEEQGKYYNQYEFLSRNDDSDSDFQTVHEGYVSITPLVLDRTDYDVLKKAK